MSSAIILKRKKNIYFDVKHFSEGHFGASICADQQHFHRHFLIKAELRVTKDNTQSTAKMQVRR